MSTTFTAKSLIFFLLCFENSSCLTVWIAFLPRLRESILKFHLFYIITCTKTSSQKLNFHYNEVEIEQLVVRINSLVKSEFSDYRSDVDLDSDLNGFGSSLKRSGSTTLPKRLFLKLTLPDITVSVTYLQKVAHNSLYLFYKNYLWTY